MFRRRLPSDQFQFVELVEHGRPDWLASACRKGVRCDVLLISGHFDGGDEFYSDRAGRQGIAACRRNGARFVQRLVPGTVLAAEGGLPVRLQHAQSGSSEKRRPPKSRAASFAAAIRRPTRSSCRSALSARHAGSNRDRMRQIFKDVPVIYGFSSKAPLGATAASILGPLLPVRCAGEIGSGRAEREAAEPVRPGVDDGRGGFE